MIPALNVGVFIETQTPPQWVGKLLQDIQSHQYMHLDVGLCNNTTNISKAAKPATPSRLENWLLEHVINKPHFNYSPCQAQSLPQSMAIHDLTEQPTALAHCDVILSLTNQCPSAAIGGVSAPVWTADLPTMDLRIKHGLLKHKPFIWIHLWDLQQGSSTLIADSPRIASHALPCQTYSIGDLRTLSYSALPNVFMSRLTWLLHQPDRKLDSIDTLQARQGMFDSDQQYATADANLSVSQQSGVSPMSTLFTLGQTIRLLLRQSYERVHHRIFTEHWQLAVSCAEHSQPRQLKDIAAQPVHSYQSVAEPADVMWADPQLFEHHGEMYVFFEKMYRHNENAHIAYAKLDDNGQIINSGIALKEDHHLSFPFVFRYDNEVYMIPETASLHNVNLYKATRFPDQWEHHKELLSDINAADTVLLQHEARWWMFTNCQSHRSVDERDELHIYHADNPLGPWHAHAQNPVLTGVDRSRMAGPVIHQNGKMYRPSQYGAYRYGYGMNISQIEELTTHTYSESATWRILPHKGAGWSGSHTIGQHGRLTIIDRGRFSRH